MKCPYCAEEINDAALVCHYCRRDLFFFAPLYERIRALETRLSALSETVAAMQRQGASQLVQVSPTWGTNTARICIFWGLVGTIGSITGYWLYLRDFTDQLYISISSPVVTGLFMGILLPTSSWRLYGIVGLALGFVSFVGISFLPDFNRIPPSWWVLYPLGQTILVLMSAGFGRWFGRRIKKLPLATSASSGLATALASVGASTKEDMPERIELWKTVLGALTPVLTLVGTVISAYFTYQTALLKK